MHRNQQHDNSAVGDLLRPRSAQLYVCGLCTVLFVAFATTAAAKDTRQARDLFEIHVRPTLVKHCIQCHGESKQEGGLRLTSIEDLLAGGDSGPAIVPGDPGQSILLEALRYESLEMPPNGKLAEQVVEGFASWIDLNADWPDGLVLQPTSSLMDRGEDWWCYQPPGDPTIPEVDDHDWCNNPIDRFVFKVLQQQGLVPASPADPETLTRRVHFAVTGLPPSESLPVAIDDNSWYEELVDQLLASSAYGENQARYWLDLVRYADSDGYNGDHERPVAKLYRDYVIRSFNQDKPYDRFVMEQLAGDEIDPGNRDALIGTMFLRHWIYEWNQRDVEGQWRQILNDVTETTADVFLAQGMKCARCHDHKFDPLLQTDYYGLQAFFAALLPCEDQPIADLAARERYERRQQEWEAATEQVRVQLHGLERPVLLAHVSREPVEKFTKEIQAMIAARPSERTPYEHQIASLACRQFDLHPEKLHEWLDEDAFAQRDSLLQALSEWDHLKPAPLPQMKFAIRDVGPVAPATYLPESSDQSPIEPAFPKIFAAEPPRIVPPPTVLKSTGRRTALARWITDPDNPLTARVIVNRVWQQHFGQGLVTTSSDFGHLGTPPSHPDLLDWLAGQFVRDGWSLKKLHRQILTSATYRQTSRRRIDSRLAELDPQNRLLWRMNRRRLSAEEIHDAMLAASSELAPRKRAIYKPVKRNRLDPLLAAFDFPDRVESQCRRHRTTTAPQALLLMNDPWLHQRSTAMLDQLGSMSLASLIEFAYRRLYFRNPSRDETNQAIVFADSYPTDEPQQARVALLHALLNSNELFYVD